MIASSSLEYEHYVLMECDPDVVSYEPQVRVSVKLEGKDCVSILDSIATYRCGRRVVNEVKFTNDVEAAAGQLAVQRAWAEQNGCEHQIVTESIRENSVYLSNCHAMLPWARPLHQVSEDVRILIAGFIAGHDEAYSIDVIVSKTGLVIDQVVPVVVREYFAGRVAMPDIRSQKFGRKTLVSRVN